MKYTHECPKCHSRQLWQIDEVRQPQFDCCNLVFPMVVTAVEGRYEAGKLELWVCARCGFSEWYAKEANDMLRALAGMPGSGVRWIDTTPQRGPFR